MLSDNIKRIRKSKGLSQEEIAIKLNVVRQTVSKWENGLSVPDSDMLITLADELDTYCIMCVYSAWFYCACGHAKFLSKVEL